MIRSAYALGVSVLVSARPKRSLRRLLNLPLLSHLRYLLRRAFKGWKEIEFECIHDANDRCFTVASMENSTHWSIPQVNLSWWFQPVLFTDEQVKMLQDIAVKCVRHLNIVGECNIQYVFNAETNDYRIIEINDA